MKKCYKCGKIIKVGFEDYLNVFSEGFKSYHYGCFKDLILESADHSLKKPESVDRGQVNLDMFQEVER